MFCLVFYVLFTMLLSTLHDNVYGYNKLCVLQNSTCSPKLFSSPSIATCNIIHYNCSSNACIDMAFLDYQHSTFDPTEPPWLSLETFIYPNYSIPIPVFNLTIWDDQWHYLKMRYKKNVDQMDDTQPFSTCRAFEITPIEGRAPFNYDCLWSNGEIQGQTYLLEVETASDIIYSNDVHLGRYIFNVPMSSYIGLNTNISNWEIFMYIEVTDPNHPIINIQQAPSYMNIEYYLIKIHSVSDSNKVASSFNVSAQDASRRVIRVPITGLKGWLYVTATPANYMLRDVFVSKSPIVYVSGTEMTPLTLCMVTTGALIPALLVATLVWRQYCLTERKKHLLQRKEDDTLTSLTAADCPVSAPTTLKFNTNELTDLNLFGVKRLDGNESCSTKKINETFMDIDLVL